MRRLYLWAGVIFLLLMITISTLYVLPRPIAPIEQKPGPTQRNVYEDYLIIDEKSGQHLMYVPILVNIDDELITEDNKRYRVIRVEENRAYARFVENVIIKKNNKNTR
jgi:hypothetical protein